MKKIITTASIALTIMAIFLTSGLKSNQNGAPEGATGAPGDASNPYACNYPGCHNGNALNASGGTFDQPVLLLNGYRVYNYAPGQKYQVQIKLTRSTMKVGGFQAISKIKGTSTITGAASAGAHSGIFLNGSYITHSYPQTAINGSVVFTYDWTAPSTNVGTITIYAAGNAANNNGASTGDYIYTNKADFGYAATNSVSEDLFSQSVSVNPNPATNYILINFNLPETGIVRARLLSLDGKLIKEICNESQAGEGSIFTDMSNLRSGLYLLQISHGNGSVTKKIFKG